MEINSSKSGKLIPVNLEKLVPVNLEELIPVNLEKLIPVNLENEFQQIWKINLN